MSKLTNLFNQKNARVLNVFVLWGVGDDHSDEGVGLAN